MTARSFFKINGDEREAAIQLTWLELLADTWQVDALAYGDTGFCPAKLCCELNFCREQLAQVLVELTNRTGISTEKRKMAIDGLDRPELGIGN